MEFTHYKELVKTISVGKELPDAVYVHQVALDSVPIELAAHLARVVVSLKLDKKQWNIVKFFKRDHKVALLNYPRFFEDAYPALEHAYTVDLERATFRESDYRNSDFAPERNILETEPPVGAAVPQNHGGRREDRPLRKSKVDRLQKVLGTAH